MKYSLFTNIHRRFTKLCRPLWFAMCFFAVAILSFFLIDSIQQTPIDNNTVVASPNYKYGKMTKSVRVGYVYSPNFMEGMNDEILKTGLAYDYLQRVSYYTNWDYVYVYGDWNTILQMLYNGEVDLMAGVSKTPERMQNILFPDYAMGSENYYIFAFDDHPIAGKGMLGLNGHRVSVNKNTIMEDMLRTWNIEGDHQLTIVTYTGNESRFADFLSRKIDATVDTDNSVRSDQHMVPVAKIGQSDYYLAVNKKRPDLVEDLNLALGKINSTNSYFTKQLSDKYFTQLSVSAVLQTDEMAWLSEHPVVVVGYLDNYLPFSDTDANGQVTGIITDIMDEIVKQLYLNDKVRFSYVPYKTYESLIAALQTKTIDVAFPINNDVARAERSDIFLSSEVISAPMYLVYNDSFSDLQLKKMGAVKGNSVGDLYIHSHFPDAKIVYYNKIEDLLDAVKNDEVDACILNQFRKDGYLMHAEYSELSAASLKEYSSRSFAVKRGNNELLSILNRGITNLPADFAFTSTYTYTGKMFNMTFRDYIMQHMIMSIIITSIIFAIISGLLAYIYLIHRNKKRMEYIAHRDGLTGLFNRRSFNEDWDDIGNEESSKELLVIAMDLNGLKKANDSIGHEAGDELIIGAAQCMNTILAPHGKVYRVGGDEFMAMLDSDSSEWPDIMQRLKDSFNSWTGELVENLSVSIGTADNLTNKAITINDMIKLADQEMYNDKAEYYKRSGLDRRKH